MEYRHILTEGEIKDGRLSFGENNLDPESSTWFERHSGKRVAVYRPDSSLINRSIVISRYKRSSWRFNCGIHTFRGLQPGNAVVIKSRADGNLEVQVGQQIQEAITPSQPRSELHVPNTPSSSNQRRDQTWLGEPLSFRGLQHSPVNEQGVVFLFGMVCKDLGYLVEAVQTGFPDCEAKRCVDKNSQRWERVRIEFEFKTSNFLKHGHNAELCDVVVCWQHDWPDCPLEVVELRKEIQKLNSTEYS